MKTSGWKTGLLAAGIGFSVPIAAGSSLALDAGRTLIGVDFQISTGTTASGIYDGLTNTHYNILNLARWQYDPLTANPSLPALQDSQGNVVSNAAFSITGNVSGFDYTANSDALTGDYLIFGHPTTGESPVIDWEITGLHPGSIWEMYLYSSGWRKFNMNVDTDGDGALDATYLVDSYSMVTGGGTTGGTHILTLVADATGTIHGQADSVSDGSGPYGDWGEWSGFQLVEKDSDNDGVPDNRDTCPLDAANDADEDGFCGNIDNCPTVSNPNQSDVDSDKAGDACDPDMDNDDVSNAEDNCPLHANTDQANYDGDLVGDVCDNDIDGDNVIDEGDTCLQTAVGAPVLANGCSVEQECVCGSTWKNHGAYVSCNARATEDLVAAGKITEEEKDAIMSEAGASDCGNKK